MKVNHINQLARIQGSKMNNCIWRGTNYVKVLLAAFILLSGCSKVLDQTNLTNFTGAEVYNDSVLAQAYLSYIYSVASPGWPSGEWQTVTDEIGGENAFFDGTVQENTVADYGVSLTANNVWGYVRDINQFIKGVNSGTLDVPYKKTLDAQALFFRAWLYFGLVKLYGGVPLVLNTLNPIGGDSALAQDFLPRNTTSQCITQICSDLDSGIVYLPGRWNNNDWGRITSGAAAALKGWVLLYYASPQFNPNDLQSRWQDAYNANDSAMQILTANGFGLNPSFQNMWFQEVGNPEAVWVTGYNNSTTDQLSKNDSWDNDTRPSYLGTKGGSNQPITDIVNAFPMQNGKDITNPSSGYDTILFYKNRDPRFYATIAYNGCTWPINGNANYRLWTYYVNGKSIEPKATTTGFYCRKAIDPTLAIGQVQYAGTDWMQMRFAQVVLDLAESANGIGDIDQAYQGIEAIRKRAGIDPGTDGLYGLQPNMTRSEMFTALLHERQIEFAFEGKRYWDLRRWKLFEPLLNGTRRMGIKINLNTNAISASDFAAARDTMNLDSAYEKYFIITPLILDTKYPINWQSNYYYFAIPEQSIQNDPKLEQTDGWPGGTFDPLQ